MEKIQLTAIIWEEEGDYVSKCPELEVASAGGSPEEALKNLKEAVELYLENMKALNMIEEITSTLKTSAKFTSTIEVEV